MKKFNKQLFSLLERYSESHSHCVFKDEETGKPMFHIRVKGGFEYMTIEGEITNDTLANLEEIFKEMSKKTFKEEIVQQ